MYFTLLPRLGLEPEKERMMIITVRYYDCQIL